MKLIDQDKQLKGQRKVRSDKHGTTTTSTTSAPPVTTGIPTAPPSAGSAGQANVEFVHPRFKEEFLSGEGESNRDNPWVWLNAYSRIPVSGSFVSSSFNMQIGALRVAIKIRLKFNLMS